VKVALLQPLSWCEKLSILHRQMGAAPWTPAVHPRPEIRGPKPSTLNYQLSTINYHLSALDPQLSTINCQPSTLNPQPSTINYQRRPSTSQCIS